MTTPRSRLAARPPWLVRFPRMHDDGVAGAGVLIGSRHVVTCAHVVDLQIGRRSPRPGLSPDAPTAEIEVEFPFQDAGTGLQARVVGWQPIAADGSGDAALLELAAPVDYIPAPLACPPALSGHRFSAHGFPRGEAAARQAAGVLRGASGPLGQWVQMDADGPAGWAIQRGFSGAPVFDNSAAAVVGIVVLRDDYRSGHLLPMSYLRTLWPQVRAGCGWRLDLDPSYRTHWLPRARGSEIDSDTGEWFFTGRDEARRVIRDWLDETALAGQPVLIVTGGPGSGKSAVLAHSLVSADPRLGAAVPTPGPRPRAGAFDVALYLRERTCHEATAELASSFGVAASEPAELIAAVQDFPDRPARRRLADPSRRGTC